MPTTSSQQWFSVLGHQGQVYVAHKSGQLPEIGEGQARVRIVSASICGADRRIVSGDKDTHGQNQSVVLGHEGCGEVSELVYPSSDLRVGDFVVVLPHIHVEPARANGCTRSTQSIEAACTSRKHTDHAGWDYDGVFTDLGVFPTANLVVVSAEHIRRAELLAPDLGRTLFTVTEPLLCCLSAYELMDREGRELLDRDFTPGRALVIGCGPIGIMHGIILSERGYDVWFSDPVPSRARLAQFCLGAGQILDTTRTPGGFDVVVVTANVLDAVRQGETWVKDGGILYLFAGMNSSDRQAAHPEGVMSYEVVHRAAHGLLTMTMGKRVLYLGHSGYFAYLAPKAIATVSANAARLSRVVTGVIQGWPSPIINARVDGVADWQTPDGSPAIIPVLQGTADLRQHGKLMIVPTDQHTSSY
jgi:threonine dehydrogenase-like Zn-dependent dehydrogenase